MNPSLLFIGGGINAYGVARSLDGIGPRLYVIGSDRFDVTRFSRLVEASWSMAVLFRAGSEDRRLVLGRLAELPKPTLLLATVDAWMLDFIENPKLYEAKGGILPFRNLDAARRCIRKDEFAEWLLERLGEMGQTPLRGKGPSVPEAPGSR